MLTEKILNLFPKKIREDIIVGLVAGLAVSLTVGLAAGLAFGLAVGLAVSLAAGLAFGLAVGLTVGLAVSLAVGLAFGLASYKDIIPFNIFIFIIGIIILMEIFYWLDDFKQKKKKSFIELLPLIIFKKLESLFEALLIVVNILNIRWLILKIDWQKYFPEILKWIGYIRVGLLIIAAIAIVLTGYLWLNSLKYRKG